VVIDWVNGTEEEMKQKEVDKVAAELEKRQDENFRSTVPRAFVEEFSIEIAESRGEDW